MAIQPQDTNFLQSTKFLLTFSRIPNVQYFCQSVNLPGVSMSPAEQETPFVKIYRPGDKMDFDDFTIDFLLDEDMQAWLEIFNWMQGMTFPENFDQYRNLKNLSRYTQYKAEPQYSDGSLNILTALNNANFQVNFIDMFPTQLSSIHFNSTDENTTTLSATATFRYTYYTVKKL